MNWYMTTMVNKVLFFLFSIICHIIAIEERTLIQPEEEYFRYRENLHFRFSPHNPLSFDETHNRLRIFEKNCTHNYREQINEQCNILNVSDSLKISLKRKNLAVFSVSIILQDGDLAPTILSTDTIPKVFISGNTCPFIPCEVINKSVHINKVNNCDVISLQEATNRYSPESREIFMRKNLRDGFHGGLRSYKGIFDITYQPPMYRSISLIFQDIFGKAPCYPIVGRFSDQWDGWHSSLVDSEQSLRIYFQNKCKEILNDLLRKTILTPNTIALGVVLHVHSRMDVCKLCNASLVQMMSVCNHHFIDRIINRINDGDRSYLFDNFYDVFHENKIQFSRNFRFRITVSSRKEYSKLTNISRVSRRNWCGIDLHSFTLNQSMDFINSNYIFHKAYDRLERTSLANIN